MTDQIELLLKVFFPHLKIRQDLMRENNTRLVHYTSAEAAMKVLRSKQFWMRESSCMNDYREIRHGLDCVIAAWDGKNPTNFKAAIEELFPGTIKHIQDTFDDWVPNMEWDTYISSFSEHKDVEDTLGRLSMWRAYGTLEPVAVVMNNDAFFNEDDDFEGVYATPVDYCGADQIKERFDEIAKNIKENAEEISKIDQQIIINIIFQMLKFIMVCTKHIGFEEEKEWRVIHCPRLEPNDHVINEVEIVNGTPQTIYKIPLVDKAQPGVVGVEIPSLIDRIIIGPTRYPMPLYKAFVSLLEECGVPDSHSKVFVSEIPLRT